MQKDGSFPFCGASHAYAMTKQQGPVSQQVYVGAFVFFTDRVILIFPPVKDRLKAIGAQLTGAVVGGDAGLHTAVEQLTNLSAEGRAKEVNQILGEMAEKYGPEHLTADHVIAVFGEWADVWPNSKVTSVTMGTKGMFITKRLRVELKPQKGMSRMYETTANPAMIEWTRKMLTKAFGSRLHEGALRASTITVDP